MSGGSGGGGSADPGGGYHGGLGPADPYGYQGPTYNPPTGPPTQGSGPWMWNSQQQQVYNWAMPLLESASGQGLYNLPDSSSLYPTQQWYQSMSPEVMSSLQAPYTEGYNQMTEQMGARGQMGSARGSMSGTGGAASGIYAEQAARGVGQQAWNLSYPGARGQYQAELGRNVADYNRTMQEAQLAASLLGGSYPTPIFQPSSPDSSAAWADAIGNIIGSLFTMSSS